jgi:uncharacterized protein YnzC (UPF0291/DUF896 family)
MKNTRDQLGYRIFTQVNDYIHNQVKKNVYNQIEDEIYSHAYSQIDSQFRTQIKNQVKEIKFVKNIGDKLYNRTWRQANNFVK